MKKSKPKQGKTIFNMNKGQKKENWAFKVNSILEWCETGESRTAKIKQTHESNKGQKNRSRQRFHLNQTEKDYVRSMGLIKIRKECSESIKSLQREYNVGSKAMVQQHSEILKTDKVRPVLVARHARGLCCRKCMMNKYKIGHGPLTEAEMNAMTKGLIVWIKNEVN